MLGQVSRPEPGLPALLAVHLKRIAPTLHYAMAQDNNHGTSEAAALFIGGSWLASLGLPGGERWARRGRHWLENRAERLTEEQEVLQPARGLCLDRHGELLVTNVPSYDLMVVPRHMAGIEDANTTENDPDTPSPLVGLMEEWTKGNEKILRDAYTDKGGTMRLGAYPARLKQGSKVAEIYGTLDISERHRHRYEVNAHYIEALEKAGGLFSGMSPDGLLPEIFEIPDHPWFIGVQYHPELKSRPFEPHPLFASFIGAAVKQSRLV